MEGFRLRIKDLDFDQRQILIRDGKGFKDRVTVLPLSLVEPLRAQVAGWLQGEALHGRLWRAGLPNTLLAA